MISASSSEGPGALSHGVQCGGRFGTQLHVGKAASLFPVLGSFRNMRKGTWRHVVTEKGKMNKSLGPQLDQRRLAALETQQVGNITVSLDRKQLVWAPMDPSGDHIFPLKQP